MKSLWIAIIMSGTLLAGAAAAQQDSDDDVAAPPPIPPIQPKITEEEDEPSVIISEREGERVEEYMRDGRVYMVKITPDNGFPPYYYMDEDGDGQLEIQDSDGQGAVRPVYWKIKEW